jgi:ribosomal protein L37AE/L43A
MEILDPSKVKQINSLIKADPVAFADIMLGIHLHQRQKYWIDHATKRINILRPGNRWGKTAAAAVKHAWHGMCKPNLEGKVRSYRDWYKAEYQTLNFGPTYELGRGALLTMRDMVQGSFIIYVCPFCDTHRVDSFIRDEKLIYVCNECKKEFETPASRANKSMLADWAIANDRSESNVLPFIEFKTGAKLLGRSYSEMGVAFKMKALAYISGDECADIAELWTFTNNTLLPRLVSLNGTIDLVGTPQPDGVDYMRMIEMAEEDMKRKDWKEDGMFYTQRGSMYENTFLPQQAIKDIERIADPILRRQIIEGEHVETGEKYFGYERVQNAVDESLELQEQGVHDDKGQSRKYVTVVDFAGGESVWADYTVILVIDYTDEPYKVVYFNRFKGGDIPIPMQYKLVEEVKTKFSGQLIIDSSALGGKNALAFLSHLMPISYDTLQRLKAEMLASLKIAFDGGQSEKRRRNKDRDEKGNWTDKVADWGLIRIPNIPVFVNSVG